jgi:charged multivesicular body protein 3
MSYDLIVRQAGLIEEMMDDMMDDDEVDEEADEEVEKVMDELALDVISKTPNAPTQQAQKEPDVQEDELAKMHERFESLKQNT